MPNRKLTRDEAQAVEWACQRFLDSATFDKSPTILLQIAHVQAAIDYRDSFGRPLHGDLLGRLQSAFVKLQSAMEA